MTLGYANKTDWRRLRAVTEDSLNASGRFPVPVSVDGKIEWIDSGRYHDNYRFWISAPELPAEWQNKSLLLRLGGQKKPARSKSDTARYLLREARTLEALQDAAFGFETPELICIVKSDARQPIGLIENWVWGMSLNDYREGNYADTIISAIAAVAAAVHRLPSDRFSHLPAFPDSRSHILHELKNLPAALFREYPAAQAVRRWILSRLPACRPAAVLHGDLLPQNIHGGENHGEWKVAVIDWEFAEIGDPALDLALVTRGDSRFLGKNDALQYLVDTYRDAGGSEITVADVRVHELLLCLKSMWSSSRRHSRGPAAGHGPDHHARRVNSLLRRAQEAA